MSPSSIAILGAGHLATALLEGFSRVPDLSISLHNRSIDRALTLARRFPNADVIADKAAFDSETCPLLVMIPGRALMEFPNARIERFRRSGRVVVSCVNGLPLAVLESRFPGVRWAKAIPSVAAGTGRSVTLMAGGATTAVHEIFQHVGTTIRVDREEDMDRLSVVTSCLPGLLSAMLDELAIAYGLTQGQTSELLLESAIGSLLLAKEKNSSFQDVVASVANPGGLTEVGVSIIRQKLPPVLAEMKKALDSKQEQRLQQYLAMLNVNANSKSASEEA